MELASKLEEFAAFCRNFLTVIESLADSPLPKFFGLVVLLALAFAVTARLNRPSVTAVKRDRHGKFTR